MTPLMKQKKILHTIRHLDISDQLTADIVQTVKALKENSDKLKYLKDIFLSSREPIQNLRIDFKSLLNELREMSNSHSQYWDKARTLIKTIGKPNITYDEQSYRSFNIALVIDPMVLLELQ